MKRIIKLTISSFLCLSIAFASILFTIPVVNAATSGNWHWPTNTQTVTANWPKYSNGSYHSGVDFGASANTPVYSTCDGEVVKAATLTGSYGKHVKIRATVNGGTVYMYYCHMNDYYVSVGDRVTAGQQIGIVGSTGNSTGPHLHYEVRNSNDYYGNVSSPNLNPWNYLPGTGNTFEAWGDNNFPGEEDTSWNVPVWKTANYKANTYDGNGAQESNRWIDQGDNCYVEKVFQNGYAWVKYPSSASSDGYRWAYTKADAFSLDKKDSGSDFPGAEDTSWNVGVWKTANYKANTYDAYGSQESNRWIDQGDNCYIEKVYQNGYAWVKYPSSASSDGYRWAFTKADVFTLDKKGSFGFPGEEDTSWTVGVWKTANAKLNTYDSNGTQESNRWIDQGDNCYIEKVYKNGYAWVQYPSSASPDGVRWAYTVASGFSLDKKIWYSSQSPVNIGTDFYARLTNPGSQKLLTNDSDNVSVRSSSGKANQVWKFDRLSDGSYTVINAADNKALDDYGAGTANGTNVQVYVQNGSNAQKWFIYSVSGGYVLRAACCDLVLDLQGGGTADGTNVQMWEKNDTAAQTFVITKLNKAGQTHVYCQEGTTLTETYISWDATADTTEYTVKIWNGTAQQGDPYRVLAGQKATFCSMILPAGYYEAYVESKNAYSVTASANIVKFTVVEGYTFIPGDINNDESVNMKDIVLLQQYLNDWDVMINMDASDVNTDGNINMKDIVLLQQYLNDWDVTLG